jgi:peptidoglycan hydrolase-like protein with peptidoglycan-binding domain
VSLLSLAVAGCGSESLDRGEISAESGPLDERIAQLDSDLAIGAQGEHVATVYEYLAKYGYFPNAELAEAYPAWRAVVPEAPADASVFDERMSEAVRAFQAHSGLVETGVVDGPTRALLGSSRCGVPEGIHEQDEAEKFALHGSTWSASNLTFRVMNTNDVSLAQAQAAAAGAFASWAAQTSKTFTQVFSGTADIQLTFAAIDGVNGILAQAAYPGSGGDITIDTAETWSVANPSPAGTKDLQSVILHEVGHSLGLRHSSISGATLLPFFAGLDRSLATDDSVGISSLYDTFQLLPGSARDIGVSSAGAAWVIGTNAVGGGFGIHKWNGSDWDAADGGAVRIAVEPGGVPWIVNDAGVIYRGLSSAVGSVGWQQQPGCAHDIGIGANGSVWVIGCTAVDGGFRIHKWNGSDWDVADGGAVRIAVGPTGIPWVVNSFGRILRRLSNAAGSVGWETLPGCANDIGIGNGNYAWVIGCSAMSGGFGVHVWNEQSAITERAPAAFDWVKLPGGAVNISVGPSARPWVVNNGGSIFRALR